MSEPSLTRRTWDGDRPTGVVGFTAASFVLARNDKVESEPAPAKVDDVVLFAAGGRQRVGELLADRGRDREPVRRVRGQAGGGERGRRAGGKQRCEEEGGGPPEQAGTEGAAGRGAACAQVVDRHAAGFTNVVVA